MFDTNSDITISLVIKPNNTLSKVCQNHFFLGMINMLVTLIGHPLLPADCVDSNGKYTQQRHDMILALYTSTHGSSH